MMFSHWSAVSAFTCPFPAAQQGFRSIYGHVLAGNQRMLKLAEWLGLKIEPHVAGQSTVRVARQLNAPDDRRMD